MDRVASLVFVIAAAAAAAVGYVALPNWVWLVAVLWVFREIYFQPTVSKPLPIPELVREMDADVGPVTDAMRRTCVVTGASGFLARHLINLLVETGAYDEIRAVDIVPPVYKHPQVVPVTANITDAAAVLKFVRGAGVVFHVASLIDLRDHKYRAHRLWDVNVTGATNVINACIRLGVERLVYTSSMAAVLSPQTLGGRDKSWWTDADFPSVDPEQLDTVYGKTKRIAEMRVQEANGRGRLVTVSLRLFVPFGAGDRLQTMRSVELPEIVHTPPGRVPCTLVYCKNWALWHKLAAEKLLELQDVLGGQAFFIDNGGEEPDGFATTDDLQDRIVACRRKNKPKKVQYLPEWSTWPIIVTSHVIDWFSAGKLNWDILLFNRAGLFYQTTKVRPDCRRIAQLLGYRKLFSYEAAFKDLQAELDL